MPRPGSYHGEYLDWIHYTGPGSRKENVLLFATWFWLQHIIGPALVGTDGSAEGLNDGGIICVDVKDVAQPEKVAKKSRFMAKNSFIVFVCCSISKVAVSLKPSVKDIFAKNLEKFFYSLWGFACPR